MAELLREVFTETQAIRFEGNGYSEEWKAEAKKRGLPNLVDTPAAIGAMSLKKHHQFLVDMAVYSELEMESRLNVAYERYIKQVQLEAETLAEVVTTSVLPAAERQLVSATAALSALGGKSKTYAARVAAIGDALEAAQSGVVRVRAALDKLSSVHEEAKLARELADEVRPMMAELRAAADALEGHVDDEQWPLPKYREMLFAK